MIFFLFIFHLFFISLLWCGFCHLFKVCGRTIVSPIRIVCIPFDRCVSRSYNWPTRTEKFRTKITRSIIVVGGTWCVCSVYRIRHYIQFNEYGGRATARREWWGSDKTKIIPRFWSVLITFWRTVSLSLLLSYFYFTSICERKKKW